MEIYNEIIKFLNQDCIKNHADLAGIVLLGSFAANQGDKLSDIDVDFVYYDENYIRVSLPQNDWEWDINEKTLADYPGITREHWSSGGYVTSDIIFDKTGGALKDKINKLIKPGFEYFRENLELLLDRYYDAYFRSMKCLRRNNLFGAHVMACNSVAALNDILYQVNGFLQTYINRLPAVIHKLEILPLPANELFDYMQDIAVKADEQSQIKVYLSVKEMMNRLGYIKIYEAWEGKLDKEIELLK